MILLIATESKEVIGFGMSFNYAENCSQVAPACESMGNGKRTHGQHFS